MHRLTQYLQILLGTSLMALAIVLLITAHQGYDTVSTFLLGVLTFIPVPFWIASLSFNIVILIIVFIFDREGLGIGSFINGIGLGILIGIFEPILDKFSVHIPMYPVIAVIFAPILFGIGAGIYVASNQGAAALEALTTLLYKRSKLSLKAIRMLLDAFFVLVGFSLGATIGIGTFLCILLIGPIFEFTLKSLQRFQS